MTQCVGRGRLRAGTNVSVCGVSARSEPCLSGPEPGRPGSVTCPLKRKTIKKKKTFYGFFIVFRVPPAILSGP